MKPTVSRLQDPDFQNAPQALLRASENARRLAEQTGTPFIVRTQAAVPTSKTVPTENSK